MATYFIADLHLYHKNIFKYEPCRQVDVLEYILNTNPSADSAETKKWITDAINFDNPDLYKVFEYWNEMLISRWNKEVKPTDTVYILGDLALGNYDAVKNVLDCLNGHKILVKGNHDNWSNIKYQDLGFTEVTSGPLFLDRYGLPCNKETISKRRNAKYVLSHVPLTLEKMVELRTLYGVECNIFGHIHSKGLYCNYPQVCVSAEVINSTPISLNNFRFNN